jgi:molybdopterin-guanine dinucleotide biosynthesis protein A
MKVSGIVLAGGQSSRMGQDKTLLSIKAETLIERTVNELRRVADEIIIASNQKSKYNLAETIEVPDMYPGMGPLGGIHAGLLAAKYQYAFIVAGDMPLFTADLAKYLISRNTMYDIVVPEVNNSLEPLCAVYSKDCLKPIEQSLSANIRKIISFYPKVRVLKIPEEELQSLGKSEDIFYNLNTPADYYDLLIREKKDVDS